MLAPACLAEFSDGPSSTFTYADSNQAVGDYQENSTVSGAPFRKGL